MASKTLMTVEEYLKTSFDGPEPDYLDGEIRERHLGSIPHFEAQERMLEFFRSLKQSFRLFAYPEVTLRLSPKRYRIADVAVFIGGRPAGTKYPADPPGFAIEIVSEDDSYVAIMEKLAEYHAWGVKHVWLVDPWTRRFFVYGGSGLHEVVAFELPECSAKIAVAEFFAD
jgi:Uma2 family endonuclease